MLAGFRGHACGLAISTYCVLHREKPRNLLFFIIQIPSLCGKQIEDGKLVDRLNSRGRSDVSKKVVGASDMHESRDGSSYSVNDDPTMVKEVSGPNIAHCQRNLET